MVKGILMLGFALLTAWLLYALYRIKPPFYPYGSTLAVTVLLLFVILNQHAIWAAMRFSPLLAAPLMWSIGHRYPSKKPRWLSATVVTLAIVLLLASQFVFSWYMARAV